MRGIPYSPEDFTDQPQNAEEAKFGQTREESSPVLRVSGAVLAAILTAMPHFSCATPQHIKAYTSGGSKEGAITEKNAEAEMLDMCPEASDPQPGHEFWKEKPAESLDRENAPKIIEKHIMKSIMKYSRMDAGEFRSKFKDAKDLANTVHKEICAYARELPPPSKIGTVWGRYATIELNNGPNLNARVNWKPSARNAWTEGLFKRKAEEAIAENREVQAVKPGKKSLRQLRSEWKEWCSDTEAFLGWCSKVATKCDTEECFSEYAEQEKRYESRRSERQRLWDTVAEWGTKNIAASFSVKTRPETICQNYVYERVPCNSAAAIRKRFDVDEFHEAKVTNHSTVPLDCSLILRVRGTVAKSTVKPGKTGTLKHTFKDEGVLPFYTPLSAKINCSGSFTALNLESSVKWDYATWTIENDGTRGTELYPFVTTELRDPFYPGRAYK